MHDVEILRSSVIHGVHVELVKGDITRERTDAIVNAANKHLEHSGGVAAAISSAGGNTIQEECRQWIHKHGEVDTGKVVYTRAGRLRCKYVIHAVGPRWGDGAAQKTNNQLFKAVCRSLTQAAKLKCKTIALPAISSNIYGYPGDLCAGIILAAILQFIKQNNTIKHIRVCLVDNEIIQQFMHKFDSEFVRVESISDTSYYETYNVKEPQPDGSRADRSGHRTQNARKVAEGDARNEQDHMTNQEEWLTSNSKFGLKSIYDNAAKVVKRGKEKLWGSQAQPHGESSYDTTQQPSPGQVDANKWLHTTSKGHSNWLNDNSKSANEWLSAPQRNETKLDIEKFTLLLQREAEELKPELTADLHHTSTITPNTQQQSIRNDSTSPPTPEADQDYPDNFHDLFKLFVANEEEYSQPNEPVSSLKIFTVIAHAFSISDKTKKKIICRRVKDCLDELNKYGGHNYKEFYERPRFCKEVLKSAIAAHEGITQTPSTQTYNSNHSESTTENSPHQLTSSKDEINQGQPIQLDRVRNDDAPQSLSRHHHDSTRTEDIHQDNHGGVLQSPPLQPEQLDFTVPDNSSLRDKDGNIPMEDIPQITSEGNTTI